MAKYSFDVTNDDYKILDKSSPDNCVEHDTDQDYSNSIVRKPWGYEYLVYDNGEIAIWMLHIARKRCTSTHCHPNKLTNLILLSGRLTCSGISWSVDLNPLDVVRIGKGVFHSSCTYSNEEIYPPSENGAFLLEIESPVDKHDLVRIDDRYGRSGKSYEGIESMLSADSESLLSILNYNDKVDKILFGLKIFTLSAAELSKKYIRNKTEQKGLFIPISTDINSKYIETGEVYESSDMKHIINQCHIQDEINFLIIEQEKGLMRLSDYVAEYIKSVGVKYVFSVCGGGAMHLVDAFGSQQGLNYIPTHHEQSAAMAAEAYARINKSVGAALFTTGPGGTNALTGVAGAWIDSIPVIYISGQVTSDTLQSGTGLRQFGIQESNIVELVRPITKYSIVITNEVDIRYELEKAYYIATSGRPGPVWIDIPLDIQSKQVNPSVLESFLPPAYIDSNKSSYINSNVQSCIDLLNKSKRPVMIIGYGVRLSKAEKQIEQLAELLKIPVISSWTSSDIFDSGFTHYIGRSGIFGDRASNFTVQNADLLLILGSRMSVPQTGYNSKTFSRESVKIMVDIDENEIQKPSLSIDLPVIADIKEFVSGILNYSNLIKMKSDVMNWMGKCIDWKKRYPVILPEYSDQKKHINSFYFIGKLSDALDNDAVIVTDMGTSFTCTMQSFIIKKGQRLTTSSGHAPMGFGLPGAIGACFANNKKKTICISGEGGLQMNIQELQTIVHYKLPIILFVLNNGGYLTIKTMQQNHFGRYVGSNPSSGISFPDLIDLAVAYKIPSIRLNNHTELDNSLILILNHNGPYICEIMMSETQELNPRSSSMKQPDGSIVSKPLEDLYPFLDRDEFLDNMIIEPLKEI